MGLFSLENHLNTTHSKLAEYYSLYSACVTHSTDMHELLAAGSLLCGHRYSNFRIYNNVKKVKQPGVAQRVPGS
jgi:hypothetical protein